ncbi:hypothetical protein PG993_014693 [Apiospora rasikravindrae]|uniref:Uncharacterized protein n=1 Tax=Apiospora rasikravindrae TaxID=990691 RepID=A0ABR1RPQ1_9PEZI
MLDSRSMECLYEHFSAQQQQPAHHPEQQRLAAFEEKNSKPSNISRGEAGRPAAVATRSNRSFWFFWRADMSR